MDKQTEADWQDAKLAWGGKRKGAGRPKGGQGRKTKTSGVSLPPALWQRLDALRGGKSRSAWIAERINKP